MATPNEVRRWDVSGLQAISVSATAIADAIIKASDTMFVTIHDDLTWKGEARQAAEDKADRERTQMRAIATAYDDLAAASAGAARDMAHPTAEIRTIFEHYVVPPVTVADDWTVRGVEDWDSEAGVQLSRLAGLASTLASADAQWGAKIAEANRELEAMAPESALAEATKTIEDIKKQNSRSNPDRLRTSAAAFQQVFGRAPTSPTDWKTAEALNPNSYDPKYQGVQPSIKVARIEPVHGQGIVRSAAFIPAAQVFNVPDYDLGDNRKEDPNFDPEHARVVTYVDYENGLIITRQNPSVTTSGEVKVGEPEVQAQQLPNGSVMIQYDAKNPFAPPGSDLTGHTVNGELVISPTSGNPGTPRVTAGGEITDYPSVEIYQDNSAGNSRPVLIDPANSGSQWGPLANLPSFHEVGGGKAMFEPFKADFSDPNWERNKPTSLGDPSKPPSVVVVRK
ncbi:hypothetical protein ACFYO1_27305 [Nocardia sp. NPDC006044]|uniref:hypothetical protein n=1 Tax=Nocardia sp. NPDC006044 TaxID=3364306 RepID=UPI0036AEFEF9